MKKSEKRLRSGLEEANRRFVGNKKRATKLQLERRDFESQANRKWSFQDMSFLTLDFRKRLAPGEINIIVVRLDVPLTRKEIERRLDRGFGDL